MLLYTIALFRTGALGAWPKWVSLVGALELAYRVPMIAFDMPSGGPQDIFMTVWQIGIGIALLQR